MRMLVALAFMLAGCHPSGPPPRLSAPASSPYQNTVPAPAPPTFVTIGNRTVMCQQISPTQYTCF